MGGTSNEDDFSMEKLKEMEEKSKAKRYIFQVSELDSNIKLKNYLIDKIENLGLQSAKSQISGKIGSFLEDVFRNQKLKSKADKNQKPNGKFRIVLKLKFS
jgi:hypothetical protein